MGDENFQQIKQVRSSSPPPPPFSALPALSKLCMTARVWRRCCRRHAALSRFIFARDICAPVVRRQRAADPSQQDVPVDEATAGARAVRAAQRPASPRFFLFDAFATGVERFAAKAVGAKRQPVRLQQARGCGRRLEGAQPFEEQTRHVFSIVTLRCCRNANRFLPRRKPLRKTSPITKSVLPTPTPGAASPAATFNPRFSSGSKPPKMKP